MYSFPFVAVTLDFGLPEVALPLSAWCPDPVMGRVIMASSRGEPVNLAAAIRGTFLTEAEDWMLYCSSPSVPWRISPDATARVDHTRGGGIVMPALSPRARIIAALNHYGTNPRYSVALQLAMVIGNSQDEDIEYDVLLAHGCRLPDFPEREYRNTSGLSTLTLVGRDDLSLTRPT